MKTDPDQMTLDLKDRRQPPQPREIVVGDYPRRNPRPRRRTMSTTEALSTEPETRTDVTAMKDEMALANLPPAEARLSDPATSHEAAKVATKSLRRRMADVLQAFQWQATEYAKVPEENPGMTDDELLQAFDRYRLVASPSGIRTARKDLVRLGLLTPRYLGEIEDTRPTRLGNAAAVFEMTGAGEDFDLARHR